MKNIKNFLPALKKNKKPMEPFQENNFPFGSSLLFFGKNHFLPLLLTIIFLYFGCAEGMEFSITDVFPWLSKQFDSVGFTGITGPLFVPNKNFFFMMLYLCIGTLNLSGLVFYTSLEEVIFASTATLFFVSYLDVHLFFFTIYGLFIFLPLMYFALCKKFYKQEKKPHKMQIKKEKNALDHIEGFWLFFYALFLSNVAFFSFSWNVFTENLPFIKSCFWLPGVIGLFFGSFFIWLMMFFLEKINLKNKNPQSLHSSYYWFLVGCQLIGLFAFQESIEFCTNIFLIGCLPFVYEAIYCLWHQGIFWKKIPVRFKMIGGMLSVLLCIPVGLFFIYGFFSPWIPQVKKDSNPKKP